MTIGRLRVIGEADLIAFFTCVHDIFSVDVEQITAVQLIVHTTTALRFLLR